MKVLGAGVALLLVVPNKLGVVVEDDEVVEVVALVGLLPIKEKDGFEAAAGSVRGESVLQKSVQLALFLNNITDNYK